MVKDSRDLLELLRKRGLDGDVDFLREAEARASPSGLRYESGCAKVAGRRPRPRNLLLLRPWMQGNLQEASRGHLSGEKNISM